MSITNQHALVVRTLGINIENLRKHREFLSANREVVEKHFNMEHFAYGGEVDRVFGRGAEVKYVRNTALDGPCGASMCLVGWAPANPEIMTDEEVDSADGWSDVTSKFIREDSPCFSLFEYLFGGNWESDLDLALERIDKVVHAAVTPDEESTLFLGHAAIIDNSCICSNDEADCVNIVYTLESLIEAIREDDDELLEEA